MAVDRETARRVAHLARIRVEEDQLEPLAGELSRILAFVEQLQEVDVSGVEPMAAVHPLRLKRRADAVTEGDRRDAVLANAPEAAEGFFAVPKVVE
jgi:aspartyl-tRNA(Asn)/glutamyl-tRNA(Gln) amidotransferase subunit C